MNFMKNNLFKQICAVFSAICLLLPFGTAYAESDSLPDGIITLLSEFNIMKGDPDGNLRLDDTVTRAEFTKAAVNSSAYKDMVATHIAVSPFKDVTYKHWSAPYVRVGVTNGLVSGYPDASFKPDENVLYEEAITIMLRVLGYTDDDFGAAWPYGQIGLANNLDMTDNVDAAAGEALNRRQVAQLIYNTLSVYQKGQPLKLISIFNTEIKEDITLIADSSTDSSIASDEVYTNQGSFKTDGNFDSSNIGLKGDVAVKNGNKLIAFIPHSNLGYTDDYIVYSILPNSVMAYRGSVLTQLDISDNTMVYKGKTQTVFSALKSTLEAGDKLKIKKSATGNIDYITWQEGNLTGPITVASDSWGETLGISADTTVMRNGISSSRSDIKTYDVVYYLPELNTVLAYTDKVTGVYENASPTKDMPTSVTISGKSYTLGDGSAFSKLASGGEFTPGDTITALLGKDGTVVDVISPTPNSGTYVGYVINTGRKEYSTGTTNTYTSYYVTMVMPDGTQTDYTTQKDYSASKNKVAKITFENSDAVLDFNIEPAKNIQGTVSSKRKIIGNTPVSADVQIIDIGTTNSNSTPSYTTIFLQRLDGINLSSNKILYSETDSKGEVSKLILDDVTGDSYTYGIMLKSDEVAGRVSGSYEYIAEGQIYKLTTVNRKFNISSGYGIKIGGNIINPDTISKINQTSGNITNLSSSSMTAGGTTYPISPKVSVYEKVSGITTTYTKIPLSDIIGKENQLNILGFYDKDPSGGGQIRIIVVSKSK